MYSGGAFLAYPSEVLELSLRRQPSGSYFFEIGDRRGPRQILVMGAGPADSRKAVRAVFQAARQAKVPPSQRSASTSVAPGKPEVLFVSPPCRSYSVPRTPVWDEPPPPLHRNLVRQQPTAQFVDARTPAEVGRLAAQLQGTDKWGDKVIRFGGGRFLVVPGVIGDDVEILDTETPLYAQQALLPPFTRQRREKGGLGPKHNYAWFRLRNVRDPGRPEVIAETVKGILARMELPLDARSARAIAAQRRDGGDE